ncbi:zinc finger protein 185 isoform X22 [Lepisosteus oculatus]|uniref:zinc finger protein 185 isoform X22 n=1 Tax=Lepisosteus oculatus TaxID=7918 RepID=UPI0037192174
MQKAERSGLPTADRQAVLRTTKVRATLKGDQSWIQHRSTSQEQEDEKPWITEVRERRNNGALAEPTVTSTPSESPRPVSPGYLIRGVFTKTDSQKDPSSSSANSHGSSADIPKSKFVPVTKKSTDDYKKIAPHGVRHQLSGATQDEPTVSPEEHSKRTEAASSVLRTSGTKQRSYVLSAAKKYESIEKTQSSDVQPALSFKAKRVEFNDEDERSPSKSPEGSTRPIAPVPEPQKTSPVPQPNMQQQPAPGPLSKTSSTATKAGLDSPLKTEGVSPGVNQKSSQVVSDKAPAPRNDFDNVDLASLISDKTDEALVKPVTPKRDSCKQDPSPVADSTQTQKPAMDSKTAVTLEQLAADVIPIDTSTKSSLDSKTDPSGTSTVTSTVTNTSSSDTKTNPFSTNVVTPAVTKTSTSDTKTISTPTVTKTSPSDTKAVSSSTNTVTPAVTKTSSSDTKTDLSGTNTVTPTVTKTSPSDTKAVSSSTNTVTPAVTKTSSSDTKTDLSGTNTVTPTVTKTSSSDTKTDLTGTKTVPPTVTKTSSSDTKTDLSGTNTVTPTVTKTSSSDTKTVSSTSTVTPTVTKTSSSDTKTDLSGTKTVPPTITKTSSSDTKAVSSSTNTVTPAVTKTSSSDTKTVSSSTSTVTPAVTKTSSSDTKTDLSGTNTVTPTVTKTSSSDTKTVSSTSTVTPTVTKTSSSDTKTDLSGTKTVPPTVTKTSSSDTKTDLSGTNTVTPTVTKTSSSDTKTVSSTSTVTPTVTKTSSSDTKTDLSGTNTVTPTVTKTSSSDTKTVSSTSTVTPTVTKTSSSDTKTDLSGTNTVTPTVTKTSSSDTKTDLTGTKTVPPTVTKTSSSDTKTVSSTSTVTPTVTKTSSSDTKTNPFSNNTVTPSVTKTSSSDTKTNPFSTTTTPSTVTKTSSADPGTPLVDVSPPKAAEKSSSDTKTDPFSSFSTAKTSPSEALDSFDPFPVQPASGPSARKSSSDSLAELDPFSSQTVTPAISKNSSEEPRSLWDEWETPEKTQDVVKSTISRSTDPKTEADRPFDVDFFSSSDTKTSSADTQSPWHMWETPEGTQTVTNVTENSEDSEADETLDELADDVIPIDTTTRSLSTYRSYSFADETHKKEPLSTHSRTEDPSQESQPDIVIFKKTSSEDDSPWDRWMSPVISDRGTTTNRSQDTETKTLTTVTEIRETGPRSSSQSLMESTVPQSSFDPYSRTLETSYTRSDSPESTESKKGYVYVKEYVNTTEMSKLNSGIGDYRRSFTDDITPSSVSYAYSSPTSTYRSVTMTPCTYCGELVGEDAKITVEHLNISCHPRCFKCGVCSKPMGDLLGSMFLHGGLVHCSSCYENVI